MAVGFVFNLRVYLHTPGYIAFVQTGEVLAPLKSTENLWNKEIKIDPYQRR